MIGDNSHMRFVAGISEKESTSDALDDVLDEVAGSLDNKSDLVFVFCSSHHIDEAEFLIERIWLELDPQAVVGCSAESVLGVDREVERAPGLVVLAGLLPDVRIHPFHIGVDAWKHLLDGNLADHVGVGPETRAIFAFSDPFTTPLNQVLGAFDRACPGAPLLGGLASAARQAGGNVLFKNDQVLRDGMVGLSLSGPVDVQTVVSQGCRPIGRPFIITKGHDNVIEQLGGKPAIPMLRELMDELPTSEQSLLENGVFVGRAISEYRDKFGRGDFLVRNLLGGDEATGAIALNDHVRVGQTIQFHVRDASTADEDLREMLKGYGDASAPAAGLIFSCNGRGRRMFDVPSHDIRAARDILPKTPLAGFFASGEFGPVGGRNFLHGHTASIALLRRPT